MKCLGILKVHAPVFCGHLYERYRRSQPQHNKFSVKFPLATRVEKFKVWVSVYAVLQKNIGLFFGRRGWGVRFFLAFMFAHKKNMENFRNPGGGLEIKLPPFCFHMSAERAELRGHVPLKAEFFLLTPPPPLKVSWCHLRFN